LVQNSMTYFMGGPKC